MGLIDSATNAVTNITNVVSSSNLTSGFTNAFKVFSNAKLPLPNELSDYATYTYVLSISVLSTADLNDPDGTYMAGKRLPLLCKTAGADPDNRINTPYGKFDFYIRDLTLDCIIGFVANKNTNVATMEFDVYEPYSMGMFMVALQEAAQAQGYSNWREVPLLMTIAFQGNLQNGAMVNIPNTTRYFPFKLGEMKMKTSEAGTEYHFTAYAHNTGALTEEKAGLKSDVAVKGKTVQEVLQTGEKSLQAVVNARLKQFKDDGIVQVPDEILILFPNDASSSANKNSSTGAESKATATANTSSTGSNIYKKLGVVRNSSTQNLVQDQGDCNQLGLASMGYNLEKKADPAMNKDNAVYDSKTNTWDQSQNKYDVQEGNLKFSQDTDIPSAINQVLLASNYPNHALSSEAVDKNGMRPLWRIDTQVYDIESDANMATTGTRPRLIVYRVIEYLAHASHLAPPNTKVPGTDNLKLDVIKEYDYIYTGKNTEVLNFEIDFSYGFNSVLPADNFKRTQDVQLLEDLAGGFKFSSIFTSILGGILGDIANTVKSVVSGNSPSKDSGTVPTQTSYSSTKASTDGLGGGGLENAINRSARYFYDAFTYANNMANLEMEVLGDPFWIAHSGQGNYTAKQTQFRNLFSDGSVNYQNGEVHINVNFRTPIDVNQATGLYDFGNKTAPVAHFSGVYLVKLVRNKFSDGRFTQVLQGYRVPQQENKKTGTLDQLFNINSLLGNVVNSISGIFK